MTIITRLSDLEINVKTANRLGSDFSEKSSVLAFHEEDEHMWMAMANPSDLGVINDAFDISGFFIVPVQADENEIKTYVNKIFRQDAIAAITLDFTSEMEFASEVTDDSLTAPAVRLINTILEAGVLNKASDIHIEPNGDTFRTRYRIDGGLVSFSKVGINLLPNVISRLKVMGGLDITEKRIPQDGHFKSITKYGKIDFRLSTLPTTMGEKAVIRILYSNESKLTKLDLGLTDEEINDISGLFNEPYGGILVTGPTGSGKSTTLNCFLSEISNDRVNVITVENPVENEIFGVNHVNIEKGGLGFAGALKYILRQDPDVIMIGEIRDKETAEIAMQASITGHLVLSTLHTNDAVGAIERLVDMGVADYLVASAIRGVISQRLVRKLCGNCTFSVELRLEEAKILGLNPGMQIYESMGCSLCNHTGYKGRIAIFEVVKITNEIRRRIISDLPMFANEFRKKASLKESAVKQLIAGRTTVSEILRVLGRQNV